MAEIEFSILNRQSLERRIGDKETLIQETKACVETRNQKAKTEDWCFTTKDARIQLKRFYPLITV